MRPNAAHIYIYVHVYLCNVTFVQIKKGKKKLNCWIKKCLKKQDGYFFYFVTISSSAINRSTLSKTPHVRTTIVWMGRSYDMKPARKTLGMIGWGGRGKKKKRHNELQLIFLFFVCFFVCAQELKKFWATLKRKSNLKFIKPINNERPDCYIKTDSLASKNLAV